MHRGALDLSAPTRDRHWEMRSNLLGTQKRMQELAPEVDCLLDATGRGKGLTHDMGLAGQLQFRAVSIRQRALGRGTS